MSPLTSGSPMAEKVGVTAALVVLAALVVTVVWLARSQRITSAWVKAMTVLCGAVLITLALSDVWGGPIGKFVHQHGFVTGLVNSVLTLGLGYFAYEYGELRSQARLDTSLTAAGLGGIVDHLIDVEVALGLLGAAEPPDHAGWTAWSQPPGKPLQWLWPYQDRLVPDENGARPRDPRRRAPGLAATSDPAWRERIVDECVRRLLAAVRDWAPVINQSRNGTHVLVAIAELRKDLMDLHSRLQDERPATAQSVLSLRQRARLLSYFLEYMSGAEPPRAEVITDFSPLGDVGAAVRWANDPQGEEVFGVEWNRALGQVRAQMREPADRAAPSPDRP